MRLVRNGLFALAAAAVLAVGAVGCFGTSIERLLNRVSRPTAAAISSAARTLHDSAVVVDLHADPLLWGRDLLERSTAGHVDLPRLREGGVALQVFSIVTSFPVWPDLERTDPRWPDAITLLAIVRRWPRATIRSRLARALHQARRLQAMANASGGRLLLIRSRADLDRLLALRAQDPGVVGALLAIEGAQALDGDPANVGALFDAGVRMIGLAHVGDNEFAGSAHGVEKGGLTAKGRTLLREAERRGMIIDLAHTSARAIEDVLAMAANPPVVSHTGVRATCDNPRNLSDAQVEAIARAGGVIGVGLWKTALCGLTPAHFATAVAHVARLAGDDHAALGSDFDGAVQTGLDASELRLATAALLDAGLGDDAIRKILGGNALRLFRRALPDGVVGQETPASIPASSSL